MPNTLPFLGAAFICEQILQEKDGVASAIRMVDTVVAEVASERSAEATPGAVLTVYVLFKSGDVKGTYLIALKLRSPAGQTRDIGEWPVVLEGGKHGASLSAQLTIGMKEFGLYWIDVYFAGQAVTSIPLELVLKEKSGSVG